MANNGAVLEGEPGTDVAKTTSEIPVVTARTDDHELGERYEILL